MILTCPECATSYFVDDDRIPAAGRTVKCSSCGNRWKALPEGASEAEFEPPPTAAEPDAFEADEPTLEEPVDEIEFVPGPPQRRKAADKPKGGPRGLAVGVTAIGLAAAAAGAVVVLREQVAGMVPGTAPLFAAIGMPVNELGLAFEGVAWKPTFVAGRPVMAVTGAIRNTGEAATDLPPIRVALLDDKKTELIVYDLAMTNARVPPGGVRYFAWNLPDPPAGADHLEIAFNPHGKAAPAESPAPAAPAEAQALPPGTPDALEKHE